LKEIKKKSLIPVYSVAAAWALYCIAFPLYRTWHFIALACSAALVFVVLSVIFPGKTEYVEIPEEPVSTGDDKVDALIAEGRAAAAEMRGLRDSIPDIAVRKKLDDIITVIESIFKKVAEDANCFRQVRRFADFYLPTTIKLLHTYDDFSRSGAEGDNITGTMGRIDTALGTIHDSYIKFYDSLFEHQALDIETDILVLESMLKNEGLLNS